MCRGPAATTIVGMSDIHHTRPAVDLAPERDRRPRLALALALLSIPGVTLAWDLPGGGFYTGIPLAIAAIVLGLRARDAAHGRLAARAAVAIGALAITFVVSWMIVSPEDGGTSAAAAPKVVAPAPDPLVGDWDSGPVPMGRIRAAIRAAGYSHDEIAAFLREFGLEDADDYEFRLTFYREGDEPYVVQRGWSPSQGAPPVDGDHGPYRLLPPDRLEITSADPDVNRYRTVFRYRITGKSLRLRVAEATNPDASPEQLRLDNGLLYALAAAPLQRTGGTPATSPPPAKAAAASAPGRLVYVEESADGMQLVTVNADGSGRTELDQLGAPEVANPDWSANGKRLVYEISDEQPHAGVVLAKADGSGARDLTPEGFQGQPAFTPDGSSIVFEREAGGNGVWIMRKDGSRARRLTRNPFASAESCGCDTDPNVSPDGRTITFVRVKVDEAEAALFAMRIDGSHLRQLTPYRWNVAIKHAWSPDGEHIVITRQGEPGGSANVVVIDADGRHPQDITRFSDGRNAFVGSYSPDGTRIVFRLEDDKGFALATMAAGGGDVRELSRSADVRPRFIDWGR